MMSRAGNSCGRSRHDAFSLVEVVIAMGVLSLSLLILMAILGRCATHVGDLVDDDEMHRIITTVNTSLQTAGLATVYGWVQSGQKLRIYSYAADPLQNVGTGVTAAPKPLPNAIATGTVGQDYIVTTGFRAENDTQLPVDLQALAGRDFQVLLDVSPFNVSPYTSAANLPPSFSNYTETRLVLTVKLQTANNSGGQFFSFTTMVLR